MKQNEKDLAYIWDMKKECEQIIEFTNSVTYEDFCKNKLIRYAVER